MTMRINLWRVLLIGVALISIAATIALRLWGAEQRTPEQQKIHDKYEARKAEKVSK